MNLSDEQLIAEAIEINHAGIGKDKTLERYEDHLVHFSQYLASAHGVNFYSARRKHVRLFMRHLEREGGARPHTSRLSCEWCKVRGYPDGRDGKGWSPSYRKSYLSAIKFLYRHFFAEEDLPDHNPAALETSPKVVTKHGYTPSAGEVEKLLKAPGTPRARLLAAWMFYAPSRLATFAVARWQEIDFDQATWAVVGKGGKPDVFLLNPSLIRALRLYRRWQLSQAQHNPAIEDALSDEDTAYVLLTDNGKPMHPNSIAKMLKWHAIRAGVGVKKAKGRWDAPGGRTSRLSPHAMRRGWATIALNDMGESIDAISEVLKHADITTTRRHYAPTKPERAQRALRDMNLAKPKKRRPGH